jgi:UDP-N-acetylmuramate dehydrogenase
MTGLKLDIQENVSLAPLTTLRIGGAARFFARAESEEQVLAALRFAEERSLPVFVLGGGSNLLIADEGFDGLVLQMAIKGVSFDGSSVTAGAGEDWDAFVKLAVDRGLGGIETLSGIPGFVGATPIQNVGAYGQEVSETIGSVRVFDRETKEFQTFSNDECRFAYRSSIFNTTHRDRYIVLAVTFRLFENAAPIIRYADLKKYFDGWKEGPSPADVRRAVLEIRAKKSMVISPGDPNSVSAGSFFKNPVVSAEKFAAVELLAGGAVPNFPAGAGQVKIPAAWLIEHSGFNKGYIFGKAGLSENHTLALINRGGATAGDILSLKDEIQNKVGEKFGIELKPEPVFLGFPSFPSAGD